jgi:spore coat polysaccharide biosynthesis protein SpsF
MIRAGVIVQARMTSTRLPGKVLMSINGVTTLDHIVRRYSQVQFIDEFQISTSSQISDDPICDYAENRGVDLYRGSLNDVLERFWRAAHGKRLDLIVRHTGDNIFFDRNKLNNAIEYARSLDLKQPFILSSRFLHVPKGMEIEIFNIAALDLTYKFAESEHDLEHVTPFMYQSELIKKISYDFKLEPKPSTQSPRCTLDTFADLQIVEDYLDWLGPRESTIENCFEWWDKRGGNFDLSDSN